LNLLFDPRIPSDAGEMQSGKNISDKSKAMNHSIIGDAGISLLLRTNLFLGTREMGKSILEYLETGGIFVPEFFDGGKLTGGKKARFDPHDLSLQLEGWLDHRYSLGIIARRQHPVKVSLVVSATDFLMFDYLSLSVASKWFINKQRVKSFLKVATDLYGIVQANSGYVQNWRHERHLGDVTDEKGNLVGYRAPKEAKLELHGLFWANFFGPEYVQMFGRARLLSAHWHSTEELPDGGLLLLISESPFEAVKSEYQLRKRELYSQLGEDAFTGRILPEFRTEGRKKRDARPLLETRGIRDDVFH